MEKRNVDRPSSGVRSEAIDIRELWQRYRVQLSLIVGAACVLGIYEIGRLLFFH